MQVQKISLEKIQPSSSNPRKDFNKEALAELGASLQQHGQQEPVKVRPVNGHFELIFGERRWRAAKLVGLTELDAIVEQVDDRLADVLRLVENVKRKDLTVFEEAEHLKLLHEKHKVPAEELAKQVGFSVRTIYENIKLATAGEVVRKAALSGSLPVSHAKLISRLPLNQQAELVKKAAGNDVNAAMPHEELEKLIRTEYMVDLRHAPFDVKQKGLACLAATCVECPRNARNLKDEYPDLKGADICTSPADARKKSLEFMRVKAAELGAAVIDSKTAEGLYDRWGNFQEKDYVKANAQHPRDAKERTWKQLLDKEKVHERLALALTPKGDIVELLDNDGIELDVKAAGKLEKAKSSSGSAPHLTKGAKEKRDKDDAAASRRSKVAHLAVRQCVERIEKKGWPLLLLKMVASEVYKTGDTGISERRGVADLGEAIEKMKAEQLMGVIFEAGLAYSLTQVYQGYHSDLTASCKALGVDLKKLERDVKLAEVQLDAPGAGEKNGLGELEFNRLKKLKKESDAAKKRVAKKAA